MENYIFKRIWWFCTILLLFQTILLDVFSKYYTRRQKCSSLHLWMVSKLQAKFFYGVEENIPKDIQNICWNRKKFCGGASNTCVFTQIRIYMLVGLSSNCQLYWNVWLKWRKIPYHLVVVGLLFYQQLTTNSKEVWSLNVISVCVPKYFWYIMI